MKFCRKLVNCQIKITREVIEYLEVYPRIFSDTEIGGVIGGSGSIEKGDAVISKISDAGPTAIRTRNTFSRDTSYCQLLIDTWAMRSNGEVDYLGEWHKHLEPNPRPSIKDINTLKQIARNPNYHVKNPILLIIGNDIKSPSVNVFIVNYEGVVIQTRWKIS